MNKPLALAGDAMILMGTFMALGPLLIPELWLAGLAQYSWLSGPIGPLGTLGMGVGGAVTAGWGAACIGLAMGTYTRAVQGALAGLLLWFGLDMAVSIFTGATGNVLGNVGFFVLAGVGLLQLLRQATPVATQAAPDAQ